MQQLRINLTPKINIMLDTLRTKAYPALSNSEIIKLTLSKEYVSVSKQNNFLQKFKQLSSSTRVYADKLLKEKGLDQNDLFSMSDTQLNELVEEIQNAENNQNNT